MTKQKSTNAQECKRYRKRLRKRAWAAIGGKVCRNCQEKARDMAHIKPTGLAGEGRGSTARYLDVLANPDCYVPLCAQCHYNLDHPQEGELCEASLKIAG